MVIHTTILDNKVSQYKRSLPQNLSLYPYAAPPSLKSIMIIYFFVKKVKPIHTDKKGKHP